MVGKCPSLSRHHHAPVLPGPFRAMTGRVADMFRQGTIWPEEIIEIVSLIEPGPFLVECASLRIIFSFSERLLGKGYFYDLSLVGDHILVQFHVVEIWVPPVKIGLSVIVDKDGGIDISPVGLCQRLTYRIIERPQGGVGHCHADGAPVVFS